jgi:Arc/MetJ-type ribon-helix-helix transcriptional regulator
LEISKESWDAMNAVQVEDEENPPKSKLFVDLVTPYIVTEEGEESDEGAGEYGENEEFGDEGTEDGVGGEEGEEPVMVTFELPESVVEELKSMFAEDDFGDVPEDVQDSIRGVITDESEEGSEGGEVTGEEGIEGADYSESRTAPKGDSLTEWHKKWAKV